MTRILLVNDDPELIELCAMVLEDAGYFVATEVHGGDVPSIVRATSPDLLVLDWVMPNMTGDQVLRELKARGGTRCPVLMLSALEGVEDEARRLGASGFLKKPFGAKELERAVERLVASPQRRIA